jgi:hypothetical protein
MVGRKGWFRWDRTTWEVGTEVGNYVEVRCLLALGGKATYSCDFGQLHGYLEDVLVEIEITLIVGKRHFNLITNFQETEIDDRGDRSSRNRYPAEVLLKLEREKKEVEQDRHSEVEDVSRGNWGGGEFIEIREGFLKFHNTGHDW